MPACGIEDLKKVCTGGTRGVILVCETYNVQKSEKTVYYVRCVCGGGGESAAAASFAITYTCCCVQMQRADIGNRNRSSSAVSQGNPGASWRSTAPPGSNPPDLIWF